MISRPAQLRKGEQHKMVMANDSTVRSKGSGHWVGHQRSLSSQSCSVRSVSKASFCGSASGESQRSACSVGLGSRIKATMISMTAVVSRGLATRRYLVESSEIVSGVRSPFNT